MNHPDGGGITRRPPIREKCPSEVITALADAPDFQVKDLNELAEKLAALPAEEAR